MYGLMAEHANEDVCVWNGEYGHLVQLVVRRHVVTKNKLGLRSVNLTPTFLPSLRDTAIRMGHRAIHDLHIGVSSKQRQLAHRQRNLLAIRVVHVSLLHCAHEASTYST